MATVGGLARRPPLQYDPLPTNTSVRVIQLLRSEGDSIRCLLSTVDLEDNRCSFDAGSYTWGNPNTIHERPDDELGLAESVMAKEATFRQRYPGNSSEKTIVMLDVEAMEYRSRHPFITYEKVDWNAERKFPIECNGCELLVSSNLLAFLKFLQHRNLEDPAWNYFSNRKDEKGSTGRPIWIDAISIDQTSLEERQRQVRMMDIIFSSAHTVIGWLGPEQVLSSVAIKAFGTLCTRSLDPEFDDPFQQGEPLVSFYEDGIKWREWLSVFALLQRLWFRRIWIVQEAVFAANLVLVCGDQIFPWFIFEHTMSYLVKLNLHQDLSALGEEILSGGLVQRKDRLIPIVGIYESGYAPNVEWKGRLKVNPQDSYDFVSGITRFRSCLGRPSLELLAGKIDKKNDLCAVECKWRMQERRNFNISSLLSHFRGCEALDPRDKIFALIPMAVRGSPGQEVVPLDVDYQMETRDVYINAAKWILTSSADLSLFSHIQDPSLSKISSLPTWVPDFSVSTGTTSLSQLCPEGYFASGLHEETQIVANITRSTLEVEGILADYVEFPAPCEGHEFFHTGGVVVGLPPVYHKCSKDKFVAYANQEFTKGKKPAIMRVHPNGHGGLSQSQGCTYSREEAWWRTLILDSFEGEHPAPISTGFAFADWITDNLGKLAIKIQLPSQLSSAAQGCINPEDPEAAGLKQASSMFYIWTIFDKSHQQGFYTLTELERMRDRLNSEKTKDMELELNQDIWYICYIPDNEHFQTTIERQRDEKGTVVKLVGADMQQLNKFKTRMAQVAQGQRMFRTKGNLLGIGPPSMDMKDEVWVIRGFNFPVILRRQENGNRTIIGECYVHGIMHGEVLEKPNAKFEKIILV